MDGSGRGTEAQVKEHAAAMNGVMLDPLEEEGRTGNERFDGAKRNIGEMLVIDGVKLGALEEIHQVGHFKRNDGAGMGNGSQPGEEVAQVVDMGKDMAPQDEVGLAPFL